MLLEGTPIVVDEFKQRHEGRLVHFLTHAHTGSRPPGRAGRRPGPGTVLTRGFADHIAGLGPTWCNGVVHCTATTEALLRETKGLRLPCVRGGSV